MGYPVRGEALISCTTVEDLTGKEGFAVTIDANELAELVDNAADLPFGIVTEGAATGEQATVAAIAGGFEGTLLLKLAASPGTVKLGTTLQITAAGSFAADAGTGSRVVCAQALQSGAANEMIEAIVFRPVALS